MKVAYGPPGLKGVTQLMAVGLDDLESTPADRAVGVGIALSAGALLLGVLTGSKLTRHLALGAGLALVGVRVISGGCARRVPVATA